MRFLLGWEDHIQHPSRSTRWCSIFPYFLQRSVSPEPNQIGPITQTHLPGCLYFDDDVKTNIFPGDVALNLYLYQDKESKVIFWCERFLYKTHICFISMWYSGSHVNHNFEIAQKTSSAWTDPKRKNNFKILRCRQDIFGEVSHKSSYMRKIPYCATSPLSTSLPQSFCMDDGVCIPVHSDCRHSDVCLPMVFFKVICFTRTIIRTTSGSNSHRWTYRYFSINFLTV